MYFTANFDFKYYNKIVTKFIFFKANISIRKASKNNWVHFPLLSVKRIRNYEKGYQLFLQTLLMAFQSRNLSAYSESGFKENI